MVIHDGTEAGFSCMANRIRRDRKLNGFPLNVGFGKTTFDASADYIRIPDIPGGLLIQFVTVPVPDGTVAQQIPFTWKTSMSKVFLVGGFIGGDVTTRRCNAQISNAAGGVINATNSGSSLGTSAYAIGIGQS